LAKDLKWCFGIFGTIRSGDIPIDLIQVCFGEEVVEVEEVLAIVEFGLDAGVSAFDIGIGIGATRRIEAMLCAEDADGAGEILAIEPNLIAFEFSPIVGLNDGCPQIDTLSFEVSKQALDSQFGIDGGAFGGKREPLGSGADIPDGELILGELQISGLRPIARLITEVFDIDLQALKGLIPLFDFAQVILLLILLPWATREVMVAQNAADGRKAARELKLIDQALSAKAGSASDREDLALDFRRDAAGGMVRARRATLQSLQPLLVMPSDPQAYRIARDGKMPCRSAKAVVLGISHENLS